MKVFVNFPETEDDLDELENRVANFRASLVIETLRQMNISNKSKKDLLNKILKQLKEENV